MIHPTKLGRCRLAWRSLGAIAWIAATQATLMGAAHSQTTSRISVNDLGRQANAPCGGPAISRNGRVVVFHSDATNLVSGDANVARDIFSYDLRTETVELVSVSSNGSQGDGSSFVPAVSADGRYVVFWSDASNLTPGDTNGITDVFLRDVVAGSTTLVSHASAAHQSGNGPSLQATITPDGRFVAFYSFASDLVASDVNGRGDTFVFDRTNGQIGLVSLSSAGTQGNDHSYEEASLRGPGISDDGRFVVFKSYANNLVPGDTNNASDIFVRDLLLGTTVRASVNASGVQGNLDSRSASMSADGRWVSFGSDANNLVANDTGPFDEFVKDLVTGEVTRANVPTGGGQGGGGGFILVPVDSSWISADGRYVTYSTKNTNLVPGDTNGTVDVFRHDRWLVRTERLCLDSAGNQADGMSLGAAISEDGTRSVFASAGANLVPGDTNGAFDIFLRDVPAPYAVFCFGDGDGGTTPCPCGNAGAFHHGCENSAGTGGAVLFAEGTARVSADTITLHAARGLPNSAAIFFQGTAQEAGGSGSPFGDGLRCLSGTRIRLGAHAASGAALASFGAGMLGDPLVSVKGGIGPAGGTRYYQVQYRDGLSFCTPSTYNFTNGIAIAWGP